MNKMDYDAMNQPQPPPGNIYPSAPPSYDDAMSQPMPPPVPMPMAPQPQPPMPVVVQQPHYAQQPYYPVINCYGRPLDQTVPVGPEPVKLNCPHCSQHIKTKITKESQKSAHVACIILCLLGCCLCSCLPYCMSSFQDVHHKCPKCNGFIGTYKH